MNSYKNRIIEILQNSDLQKVTPKSIRLQLQQEFNVDLSSEKSRLKTLIFQLLDSITSGSCIPSDIASDIDVKDVDQQDESKEQHDESDTEENREETREETSSKSKRKRSGGFQKQHYLSQELSGFLNKKTCSRTAVTKEIWDYIKSRNLQDSKDKRYILADDSLFTILKKKRIHMFQMTKVVSSHIKEGVQEEDILSESLSEKESTSKASKTKTKKVKRENSSKTGGFHKEYTLSKELSLVLEQEKSSRPQVVKKLWDYIKSRNLQDPKDKRFILADDALFNVFKTKRLNGFKVIILVIYGR